MVAETPMVPLDGLVWEMLDSHLQMMETLMNDAMQEELCIREVAPGVWQWWWKGGTGTALALGSALQDALCWNLGICSEPPTMHRIEHGVAIIEPRVAVA